MPPQIRTATIAACLAIVATNVDPIHLSPCRNELALLETAENPTPAITPSIAVVVLPECHHLPTLQAIPPAHSSKHWWHTPGSFSVLALKSHQHTRRPQHTHVYAAGSSQSSSAH